MQMQIWLESNVLIDMTSAEVELGVLVMDSFAAK